VPLAIDKAESHIWLISAEVDDAVLARLGSILDSEERRLAGAFRFDADRRLSIVSRAALRFLIGQYFSQRPANVRFTYGPEGKPSLESGVLEFNVTNSAGLVAITISGEQPVGIDLEKTRAMDDFVAIADRHFAEREAQAMRDAAEAERLSLFFDLWTAKEAVVKGVGGGLSIDLQSFETVPTPGRITPVENCGADPRLNGWFVYALPHADETLHVAMALRHPVIPTVRELDAALIP
jgi:4'-phosphopantetheinyl transferase